MNELITACLTNHDISPLAEFPEVLMTETEQQIVNWIHEYAQRHGTAPTIARVTAKFDFFIPLTSDEPLPLTDILELTQQRKVNSYALARLDEVRAKIKEGEGIDLASLMNVSKIAAEITQVSKYSTFDRSHYFRTAGRPIGLKLVDQVTGGVAKGEYFTIAGRLGIGKTTFLLWIVNNWRKAGAKILLVSREMPSTDIYLKLDAINGGFDSLSMRIPKEMMKLKKRIENIANVIKSDSGEIIIPSKAVSTPARIFALGRNLQVDAIAIDGIYLLHPDGGGATAKWERVAEVSNAIKEGALDLQVPVLATTQIKRGAGGEKYDDEALAFSDALGQDADFVLAMKRDEASPQRVEGQLIKNRFGPEITTLMYLDNKKSKIVDESFEGTVDTDEEPKSGKVW